MQALAHDDANCWILTDGRAGNLRQTVALADALGLTYRRIDLALRGPWRWLAPALLRGRMHGISPTLHPPWPRLAIGCGRSGAVALDALPGLRAGGPLRVQILDPRCPPERFDVVIAPEHDDLKGANVLPLIGSLNPIDDDWIAANRALHPQVGGTVSPRTLLLVGGPRRQLRFARNELRQLLDLLEHWQHRDQGGLWISLSGRTPMAWRRLIEDRLTALQPVQLWRGSEDGENPFAAWMAWAERVVVTPDSVNMLSEACATGVPVYTHAPLGVAGRLAELHRSLRDSGRLRPLRLEYQPWTYAPLRETSRIAAQVVELMRHRDDQL